MCNIKPATGLMGIYNTGDDTQLCAVFSIIDHSTKYTRPNTYITPVVVLKIRPKYFRAVLRIHINGGDTSNYSQTKYLVSEYYVSLQNIY